jgi:hypothetical protein|tara:strand:+ start:247 stop:486 length:240 start_codon:yes stop_codon:yes gene_type:complete
MSKMGNIHYQAQEDAISGIMDKRSYLDEYGDDALDIWEEFNGEEPDDDRKQSSFWLSQQPQTDREIQTEHWADDRRIDF